MTIDLSKKIQLKISLEEIEKKLDLIYDSNLDEEVKEFIKEALRSLVKLDQLVGANELTIARLRKIFDKKSEKNPSVSNEKKDKKSKDDKGNKGRKKGQGNFGEDDYPNAAKEKHELPNNQKENQICPSCNGKDALLKKIESEFSIRIEGSPVAKAIVHEAEQTECPKCGAKPPSSICSMGADGFIGTNS